MPSDHGTQPVEGSQAEFDREAAKISDTPSMKFGTVMPTRFTPVTTGPHDATRQPESCCRPRGDHRQQDRPESEFQRHREAASDGLATLSLRGVVRPRSPCSAAGQSRYWITAGRSNPYVAFSAAIACGLASWPSIISAGLPRNWVTVKNSRPRRRSRSPASAARGARSA